jgi:patatin-related protein
MNIEIVKEIRFAVVMYGGVSLAIYINGVAQELLRMVRATAVTDDAKQFRISDDDLTETDRIYRDLAYLIADKDLIEDAEFLERYGNWLKNRRIGDNPLKDKLKEKKIKGESVKVARFIVDILSGSSAGGINGVYMAKALAVGQSLDTLEKLWITEGDFAKLLWDKDSIFDKNNDQIKNLGLENPKEPPSLLNSQRMYLKLLMAFDQMDRVENEAPGKPFVDEVDLFVTMTDYWGIPVPLRLFDQLIYERRHRQNLHFRFRKDNSLNDFDKNLYPFLAYAARCTSSFPLAFDAMQLVQADQIIKHVNEQHKIGKSVSPLLHDPVSEDLWKRSFKPVTIQGIKGEKIEIKWNNRVFVDGGYLDNKPFGYAIEALAQKQSDVLVDRKLIYVEPEPDADDNLERVARTTPPRALENTLAALTKMPRYETIREDLQQVLQRNRLITRVNHLVADARKDEIESLRLPFVNLVEIINQHKNLMDRLIEKYGDAAGSSASERVINWEKLELREIAQQKGQIAYPYYRLRVAALTDHLARMVTHRAGFDDDSDYFLAVRDLVYSWRRKRFKRGEESESFDGRVTATSADDKSEDKTNAPTPMLFLRDYDFNYRLRRLRFVLQQADRLLQFDIDLRRELSKTKEIAKELRQGGKLPVSLTNNERKALQTRFSLIEIEVFKRDARTPSEIILENQGEELRQTVRSFKKAVNEILREFRSDLRQVEPNSVIEHGNPNKDLIEKLNLEVGEVATKIGTDDLEFLLGKDRGRENQLDARNDLEARRRRAEEYLLDRKEIETDLNAIGETLEKIYSGDPDFSIFAKSRNKIYKLFNPNAADSVEQRAVQKRLQVSESDEIYFAVRAYLWHFYDNFDAYDQIIFPVTYETPIGEGAIIDVARISPLDAPSLIDENAERNRETEESRDLRFAAGKRHQARRKVAGGVFFAFGAFFSEDWRKNDILWGRLDAVERLASIVLNDSLITNTSELQAKTLRKNLGEVRKALVAELHETILEKSDFVKSAYAESPDNRDDKFPLSNFVRKRYGVNRNLPEESVFSALTRVLVILQKVLREDFGKLALIINILFNGLSLTFKPAVKAREWRKFFKQLFASKAYFAAVILALLSPILILAAALLLTFWFPLSARWILLAGLILVIGVYLTGFWFVKKLWKRLILFVNNLIYSKVTGVERRVKG